MGSVYVETQNSVWNIRNNNTKINGTDGLSDRVSIGSGVTDVVVSSTVEEVDFSQDISNYKFKQGFGSNMEVQDLNGSTVITLASISGKQLSFGNSVVDLAYSGGKVSVGGAEISTTANTVTPLTTTGFIAQTTKTTTGQEYLEATDSVWTIGNSNTKINGTAGSSDRVSIGLGVTNVVVSSTIEEADFSQDTSNYKFKQGFGSNMEIQDLNGNTVMTLASVSGKKVSFNNSVVDLAYNGDKVSVGGTDISTTASTITPTTTTTTTSNTIAITSNTTAVNGVAEKFTYAIDSSTGTVVSKLTSDITLSGFTVGEDSLTFTDVSSGTVSTATFVSGVTVSTSSINNLTDIIFNTDTSGNTYQLTLAGVVDSTLSTVDMTVA